MTEEQEHHFRGIPLDHELARLLLADGGRTHQIEPPETEALLRFLSCDFQKGR